MIIIRSEKNQDIEAIHEVNRLAFGQEDEGLLIQRIRSSSHFIPDLSLVAVKDGHLVGHILFSRIEIECQHGNKPVLSLAPMAVHPEFQNQGIGSKLVRDGLKRCKNLGHEIVIVIGHPAYYPRFGFAPAREKGLDAPFPVPDEAFMVLELVPDALERVKGMVKYPSAFDETT
ncbi:MAG: N-acetyltransferase [Candidatus Aminicenantes bacterium]|nr:N-acetyltransferase [Candidatus Aminicenantes bacterium]MDH5384401.1 N-acetyltransferase [Candidatus Aminicenantes bacterium]MDH5743811.1 N-acetyltransferase [Candidatus Aminicenantes bacterium]